VRTVGCFTDTTDGAASPARRSAWNRSAARSRAAGPWRGRYPEPVDYFLFAILD
jgi:hypothetical protein